MTVNYRGIKFDIIRKCTNNIVISLNNEKDTVCVTAPFTVSDEELKNYLSANAPKIKKTRERINENANEFIEYFSSNTLEVFGKYFFTKLIVSGSVNSFAVDSSKQNITVTFKAGSTLEQRAAYIKTQYCDFLTKKTEKAVSETLKALEKDTKIWKFNWNIEKWVAYDIEKDVLYINPQTTTQTVNFLKFAILDELMKCSATTDSAYNYFMDSYIRGWKKIRQWYNAHVPHIFARRKTNAEILLVEKSDIDRIKNEVADRFAVETEGDGCVQFQNIINLSGKGESEDNILASFDYDAIVSVQNKNQPAQWYRIPCNKRGSELYTGKISLYLPKLTSTNDDYFPEEFVPPISEDDYADIANSFLEKYCPMTLEDNDPVPIKAIAENLGFKVIAFDGLEEKLSTTCITVFDDCEITDKQGNVIIADAKCREIYIDSKKGKEEINSRVARAYYHWKFHRAAFSYLSAVDNSNKKENICIFDPLNIGEVIKNPEMMSARERIDEQALRMAAMTIVPNKNLDEILDSVINELYEKGCFEALLKLLSKHFKTDKSDIRIRLRDKGFNVDEYIKNEEKNSLLYMSIVEAVKNSKGNAEQIQDMNDSFSATLDKLIKAKRTSADKDKKSSAKLRSSALAEAAGISDHTLSRMRTKDGLEVSLQMILGLCCGLKLSLAETEMLLDKSPFRLQPAIPEHYAYISIIPLFKDFSIVDINDILDKAGVRRIGTAKDLYVSKS